jgi:hypothetical protein
VEGRRRLPGDVAGTAHRSASQVTTRASGSPRRMDARDRSPLIALPAFAGARRSRTTGQAIVAAGREDRDHGMRVGCWTGFAILEP